MYIILWTLKTPTPPSDRVDCPDFQKRMPVFESDSIIRKWNCYKPLCKQCMQDTERDTGGLASPKQELYFLCLRVCESSWAPVGKISPSASVRI